MYKAVKSDLEVKVGIEKVELKEVMRRWPSGVAVLTSVSEGTRQGMTVNSFTSVAVDPPMVTVTMTNTTRTKHLVDESGYFAINLLPEGQEDISDLFAGRVGEAEDRFTGLEIRVGEYGQPLLADAVAWMECRVVHQYEMAESTLYVGEVLSAEKAEDQSPLVYLNRGYHRIT